ncbi:MAG TPA: SPOR domain-containing protein [Candidatus Acidoferrales bacterium]|nr:SPOR domain-containing protein [Candidatus Acidoferrales bacterium]
MAGGRKAQSDVTLGGGHVAVIFLGVVVLCGIFFSLGYVMGRNGNTPAVTGAQRSPAVDAQGNLASDQGAPGATGWDFYPKKGSAAGNLAGTATPGLSPNPSDSSGSAQPPAAIAPLSPGPGEPVAMTPKPASLRAKAKPPALAGGDAGVALQVAALANQADALALAGFLKHKGYPAFAWGPAPDRLFRVQVGPYPDAKAAESAKKQLEREGFKSILKR